MGGVTKIKSKRQKGIILSFLIIFVCSFFLLAGPRSANAQLGGLVTDIDAKIDRYIEKVRKELAAGAWKASVRYLTQQIAHDLAVAAASGDIGQFEMFQTKERTKYITQLGDAAVGDLLDELVYKWTCEEDMTAAKDSVISEYNASENKEEDIYSTRKKLYALNTEIDAGKCRPGMGVRLCSADPSIKVKIMAGVDITLGGQAREKPNCTLSQMAERFGDYGEYLDVNLGYDFGDLTPLVAYAEKNVKTKSGQTFHDIVTQSLPSLFSDAESDTAQYLQISMNAREMKEAAEEKAKEEQLKEWKCVRDMITGKCKTPSVLIGETQKIGVEEVLGDEDTFTGSLIADAIGTFANTFMQQYIKNMLTKGLTSGAEEGTVSSYAIGGVAAAKAKFASFTKPKFGPSGVVNILSELATCPENPTVNNCVIDQRWEQAIEKKMRLEDAISDGYIDATRPFAFGINGQELDYNNGLPYRSIIILRKYGIVPVTWEIAARYIKDHGGGNITLEKLIDDFTTVSSSYYGLVSDDWVLTTQENYCRRQGLGETIAYENWEDQDGLDGTPETRLVQRSTQCVDDQTCIQEEEDGSCRAYGYCAKQKAIWRFSGTQCSEEYASCEKFINSSGTAVTYLKDTLDFNGCNADNAGCGWYCKDYNATDNAWNCFYDSVAYCAGGSDNGDSCDVDDDCAGGGVCTNYSSYDEASFPGGLATDKIAYLDGETETCTESSAGCHEFLRADKNLIANGSFEYVQDGFLPDDNIEDEFSGWTEQNGNVEAYQVSDSTQSAYVDTYAAYLVTANGPYLRYQIDTGHDLSDRKFTLSFYGKGVVGATTGAIRITGGSETEEAAVDYTSDFSRFTLTHIFGSTITDNVLAIEITAPTPAAVLIDAVQLEEGSVATDYQGYLEGERLYLNNERLSCGEDEVGCALYTSVSSGEEIPARYTDDSHLASPAYTCPVEMVGCQAVEEVALEPTNNVPCWDGSCENNWMTGKRCFGSFGSQSTSCSTSADCSSGNPCLPIVSLIPLSGQQCSAIYNGCQEYTNLDVVAEGGEGLEYYSYVRQCVPPDHTAVGKYYTWVGDDTQGYQLIEWDLMKSNSGAPCQNLSVGDDPLALTCEDNGVSDCVFGDDPDCREYFDENLIAYKRLESKTIRATDECHPLRNTYDDIIYYGQPSLSYTCPADMTGCREYRGSNGNNINTVLDDDFEDGTNEDWDNLQNSSTSVFINGYSGVTAAATTINKDVSDIISGRTYLLSFWAKAEYGSLLTPTIGFQDSGGAWLGTLFANPGSTYPGEMKPPDDTNWYYYNFGPVTVTWDPATTPTYLVMDNIAYLDMLGTYHATYFEKISLTETTDQFYLIKNSATLCQGDENCEEYRDTYNQSHYLKNFAQICPEDKVGCEALFDTQNAANPFSETFGLDTELNSQITVPADAITQVVVDEEKECSSDDRGCAEVGIPIFDYVVAESDSVQTITEYETFYLKDDADNYDTIWCNQSELWCREYTTEDDSYYYFKNPQDRTCIYTRPSGQDAEDWYKWGYDELEDYTLGKCPVNTTLNQPQAEIDTPNNWVGICDDASVGCTAYRDPKDPDEGCYPECPMIKDEFGHAQNLTLEGICSFGDNQGKVCVSDDDCPGGKCINLCQPASSGGYSGCEEYDYLAETVDLASCYDVVNEEEGCKLFYDPTGFSPSYSAEMSTDGYSPMNEGYCDQKDGTTYCDSNPAACYTACDENSDCQLISSDLECVEYGDSGSPAECLDYVCAGGTNPGTVCTPPEGDECDGGICVQQVDPNNGGYCDSNVVMAVQPDRVCDEWLGCKIALEVDDPSDLDKDGKTIEMACFELGTCQELGDDGQCLDFIDQEQVEIMGSTSNLSDMQFAAGYVYPGFELGHCSSDDGKTCRSDSDCVIGECLMIEGYFPYSAMTEVGLGGSSVKDLIDYGDFESGLSDFLRCSGPDEYIGKPCILGTDCGDEGKCQTTNNMFHKDGTAVEDAVDEDDNNSNIDSNNILKFKSDFADDYLLLGIGQNKLADGEEYVLSFDGAFVNSPLNAGEKIVAIDFLQKGQCSGSSNACLPDKDPSDCPDGETCDDSKTIAISNLAMSTTLSEYTLNPVMTSAPSVNSDTYIRFQPATKELGLKLDNVSLKPVLAVGQLEEAEVFAESWVNDSTFTNVLTQTFGHPREDNLLGQGENCDLGWCMGTSSTDPGPHSCSNIGDISPDCADAAPDYPDCDVASWCALSLGDSSEANPDPTTDNTYKITVGMGAMVSDQEGDCDVNTGGTGCDLWVDENGTSSTDKFKVYVSPTLDIGEFEYLGEAAGNQVGYFDISGSSYSAIRYVMIVDNSSGGGANNAGVDIDSVTSLNIPYDLISRSCRAYPEEDSLVCHYFDDNSMEYNGWQGYCIDRDPANPDRCITWYPVDVISGESLAFGVMGSAGYASSGERSPLYVCLDMGLYEYRAVREEAGCWCDPEDHPCGAGYDTSEGDVCGDCGWFYKQEDRICKPIDVDGDEIRDDGWQTYLQGKKIFKSPEPDETVAARCDVVAKVVNNDGSNKAWSGRIQKNAYNIINVDWKYDQDFAPYGSIDSLSGDPDTWDTDMYCVEDKDDPPDGTDDEEEEEERESCDGNEPLYWSNETDKARAGSPYACRSDDPSTGSCETASSDYGQPFAFCFGATEVNCKEVTGCGWSTTEGCEGAPATAECTSMTTETDCKSPFCSWDDVLLTCSPASICDQIINPTDCGIISNCEWNDATDPKCQSDCDTFGEASCAPQSGCFWTDKEDPDDNECVGVMPEQCDSYSQTQCGILDGINLGCAWQSMDYCTGTMTCASQDDSTACGLASNLSYYFDCEWTSQMTCDDPKLNLTSLPYQEASNDYTDGVWRARRLFADVYDVWVWDGTKYNTSGSYTSLIPGTQNYQTVSASEIKTLYSEKEGFSGMIECNGTGIGPRPDYPYDYCYILPTVSNLKVNAGVGIKYLGSSGNAIISFNTAVDAEQLPLDSFVVDWGDGSNDDSISWGGGAPKSDPELPHVFSKVYTCSTADANHYKDNCYSDHGYELSGGGGCCAYVPSVTAYDNWDFWGQTYYNGKIIVTP